MGMFARPKTLVFLLVVYGLHFVKQYHKGWKGQASAPVADGTASSWLYLQFFLDVAGRCCELFSLFSIIPQIYYYLVHSLSRSGSSGAGPLVNSPESFRSYGIIVILFSLNQFPLWTGEFQQGLLAVGRTYFIWPATLVIQLLWVTMSGMALFHSPPDGDVLVGETKETSGLEMVSSQREVAAESNMEKGVVSDSDVIADEALNKGDEEDTAPKDKVNQASEDATWPTFTDAQEHKTLEFLYLFVAFLIYLLFPAESPAKPEWIMLNLGYSIVWWCHRTLGVLTLVLMALHWMKRGGKKVLKACRG